MYSRKEYDHVFLRKWSERKQEQWKKIQRRKWRKNNIPDLFQMHSMMSYKTPHFNHLQNMILWLTQTIGPDSHADLLFKFYQANRFKRMKFFMYKKRQWAFHQLVRKMIGQKKSKRARFKAAEKKRWKKEKNKRIMKEKELTFSYEKKSKKTEKKKRKRAQTQRRRKKRGDKILEKANQSSDIFDSILIEVMMESKETKRERRKIERRKKKEERRRMKKQEEEEIVQKTKKQWLFAFGDGKKKKN